MNYELFFFFFFVVFSTSNNNNFENQSNSKNSNLNSIFFNIEKNAKKSKTIANLVTKASSSSNNNAIIIEDLNNNNQYHAIRIFASKDNNDFSFILFSRSSLNKSTSLESIKLEKSKITKQSWKSISFTKFAKNKKISKRFKQTRVSVINNFDLDILQQILSEYFKEQTQSTKNMLRQQSLLKKTNDILQKNLVEIKKLY